MWGYFGLALAVGAAGVACVHVAQRRRGRETGTLQSDIEDVERSLEQITSNIQELNRTKTQIDVYQIRHRIDDIFSADLSTFVDARESIGHVYGLDAYADMMMHFAAGERYLNRIWSASADGYIDEVHAYLERAEDQFIQARDEVRKLKENA